MKTVRIQKPGYDNLPEWVKPIGFDPLSVESAIVHVGGRGFVFALFAKIINDYMAKTGDLRWGMEIATLKSRATIDELEANGFRYMFFACENERLEASVQAPFVNTIFAGESPYRLVRAMSQPRTKIISLTISSQGYYGQGPYLDMNNEDIKADLAADPDDDSYVGHSIYWYFLKALLIRRRARRSSPLSIISLDNIPNNSLTLKQYLLQYIQAAVPVIADELVAWIEAKVDFLTTLADRITPKVTAEFRAQAAAYVGFDPVVLFKAETYWEFVVQRGRFDLPKWDSVGVKTVPNIWDFWVRKFLAVNAGHHLVAMVGQRLGRTYVHEAVEVSECVYLLALFHKQLGEVLGSELMETYGDQVIRRFRDVAAQDTLLRIGARTTNKTSERLVNAIQRGMEAGVLMEAATLAVACYLLNLGNVDEFGNSFKQDDAQQEKLVGVYEKVLDWCNRSSGDEAQQHELGLLLESITVLTGNDGYHYLATQPQVLAELAWGLTEVHRHGIAATIRRLQERIQRR